MDLKKSSIPYYKLTGATTKLRRNQYVQEFQKTNVPSVFLISLKAGGVGLNLTAADYVFIADPWWNPAAEAQARDRSHRIGQTKPVFSYKFISR
jgi:SNF2 family DNA or RNA helicase